MYKEEMSDYTIEGREWLRDRHGRVNEWYLEERSLGEFGIVKATSEQLIVEQFQEPIGIDSFKKV